MIRNRLVLKSFAILVVLEMLPSLFWPGVSLALTSGPTAPEATSFEPVDTTDMVNLVTGDFVYNLPLLEVPGPSGGYPLSLSYHSGIKLDQDASWVGLGWTLNPGAINRSVNGFADDNQNISNIDRSFWEGGETSEFSIGIGVGIGGMASVNAGLVFAEDTYKGSGMGYYYGAGLEDNIGLGPVSFSSSLNHQGGVSPYGDRYSSTGFSVGIGKSTKLGIRAAANVGVSIDQDGKTIGSVSGGVNSLGATMSTSGGSGFSVGGFSGNVHNGRSGEISTDGYKYSASIPLGSVNLRLSKSYQRYWIDETANVGTYGSLYFPATLPSSGELDTKAFDVYDLQYPYSYVDRPPDETLAGAFIDYDNYTVLGQGIGGTIRPYHYQSYLVRQNKLDGSTYKVKSFPVGVNAKPHFRFVGDFSNRFEHNMNTDSFLSNSANPLSFAFSEDRRTGENGSEAYDANLNVLPGSRHVEWFTNAQINDNARNDVTLR